ncbi:uncharacterized protein LOC127738565 [Mytilus californianus]|uniref:uncharacterized protein LOC127738565 n=1 Tax=Mytilus californianus TaxID=6549 RepID=UPI0022463108|nr:uncharacterized protein LOC127738565 [Mytilus californianus]XP_052105815.1 uncharacterized protein LOC127738565 [Mytilus californianus]XP_052105816.1 uncharacterized protein LOC127738565 [Mytilus californianus]XP_052105817.1 uncharacterized protein LOC127738565 [Mytilus californianus]
MQFPITSTTDFNLLKCNTYVSILHKIVFDDLTELLRELLQHSIADSQVEDYYKAVRGQFPSRFIQREEELIINAVGTGYKCFDITIITKLLRHLPEKIHFETHLSSLARVRNEICHLPNTDITQPQFETYFDECCDIASALEDYLKKPKLLVQKFQIIYEVNIRSKEGRTDLQIEALNHSLIELNTEFQVEEICYSDLEERLYILEEQISQIDRQTDERHRQVVYLKTVVQQVHEKFDPPEEGYWNQNAQEGLYIEPDSLKHRETEPPDKARQGSFLDITAEVTTVEKESCERHENIQHCIPFTRPTPYLESLNACGDHGYRTSTNRNPTAIGTCRDHSAAFPTIKPVFCDKRSSNEIDGSVVHLKDGTTHRFGLGQSSSSHVEIVENKRVLQSSSTSVDTIIQLSDEEFGACRSQSQDDKLPKTHKEEYYAIQTSNGKQIQVGDSLAKTDLLSGYPLPSQGNVSSSNGIDIHQNYKKQSSRPHLLTKLLSLLPSKPKQLCDFVFSSKRNRKRMKRRKRKDSLDDLGVEWRLGDKKLNKEFKNDMNQDLKSYCGTAVVLHSNDDNENAAHFQRELNIGVPNMKIEFQAEVCLPGQFRSNVIPYLERQYIFVLISKNYKKSADFQFIVEKCLLCLEKDKKYGQLIPVLMTKQDKLPDEFLAKKPVAFFDEHSMKKLFRSISC